MKFSCKTSIRRALAGLALFAILVTGCAGPDSASHIPAPAPAPTESRLRSGDQLIVRLDTGATMPPQSIEVVIDENNEISLPLIGRLKAGGRTPAELAEHIQASYVPRFYVRCTAQVLTAIRFFYIGGEVRSPGRFNWTEDVTLLKAINTAGGFTDFANRRKVEVTRNQVKQVFDAELIRQQPAKDFPIQPGDSVYVPRSIF
jgi:polysaccharide export outer membrane protein